MALAGPILLLYSAWKRWTKNSAFWKTQRTFRPRALAIRRQPAVQQGTATSPSLPSYRTPAQQSFFTYRSDGTLANTAIAGGKRTRLSPQGYWYSGPVGVFGEYVISKQEVTRGTTAAELENKAWQIAASWMLSGHKLTYRGVSLSKPFDPKTGSWGALELKARYSKLEVDKDAFPIFADPARSAQAAKAWAVGINWYWSKNVKFSVDYEQTDFTGGAATGDRTQEKIIFSRLQLSY